MIANLAPYPHYKESSIPWARSLPADWHSERAKWLFTKMQRAVRPQDEVVTCFRDGMVTLRKNRRLRGYTEATVESGYQGIRKGDLVIHGMDAFAGAIGVSDSDGKCTPVYSVCEPHSGINAWYYAHAVRQMSESKWILALAKGIRERSTDFRFDTFGNQRVPLPPPSEQAAIVRFLEWANGRLGRAIRAKRKVIALLNEQKHAIIRRAVTRGVDPSVSFKSSGVQWLGDIPQHWEVRRLKNLARFQSGEGITSLQIEAVGPFPVYGGNGLRGYATRYTHEGHYALIGRQGALCGNIHFADGRFFASEHAVVPTLQSGMSVVWFGELLQVMNLNQYSQSAAQPGLTVERIKNLYAPVPPTSEQQRIVDSFERNTAALVTAVSHLEREIELLHQYRIRVVADVVTGKLDVRDAATWLPDETLADTGEDDVDVNETEAAKQEAAV